MMKKILSLIFFTVLVLTVSAQVNIEKSTEKVIIDGKKYYIHTIQSGQTLYSIGKAYDVSVDDIKNSNPDISEKLKLGDALRIPIYDEYVSNSEYIIYSIRPGDTMYSLCRKYGITIDEFYRINDNIKQNSTLKVGQKVKLPSKIVEDQIIEDCIDTTRYICHLVIKGETLYGLAKKYKVTKEEIIEANPNFDGRKLKVGTVLQIPKISNEPVSETKVFIDSLANVNSKEIPQTEDFDLVIVEPEEITSCCDSSNWYKCEKDFEISILLPFDAGENMRNLSNQDKNNKKQMIAPLPKNMISFYAGALVALDNLNTKDVKVQINVYDVGKNNTVLNELINENKLSNSNIIIGPAYKSQVEFINDKLNNKNTCFLLPFISDDDILRKYPRNIMLTPSNNMVKDAIVDYVTSGTEKNIIIIQGSGSESIKVASEYQRLFRQHYNDEEKVKIIKYDGKNLISLNSIVVKDMENVFITTVNDEASITQILTNLFPLKNHEITFIGDEHILEYETIDPSYYSKVKFTYFSHSNIDYSKDETIKFLKNYRETFLFEPSEYAFWGYDAMNNFLDILMRYGSEYMKCLDKDFTYYGQSGIWQFVTNSSYRNYSYTNRSVYLYSLQPDYNFELVYPMTYSTENTQNSDIK